MMLSLVVAIPHSVVEFGIVISLSSCVNVCHNNQIYYSTHTSINCVKLDGTEVFSYEIPNEEDHRKISIDRNGNVYPSISKQ
jgi:hypothetical protein